MKIIKRNEKEGLIKLKIESPTDLWHLSKIIEGGDLVRARTTRKVAINRGGEIKAGERRPMMLMVEAEKTELTDTAFRVTGKIKEGPEDIQLNSYHTIQIEPGMDVDIKKEWKKYHIERIRKAQKTPPAAIVCVLDRERADIARLDESTIKKIASVKSTDPEEREGYYNEIKSVLEKQENYGALIIAGPGFEKENFIRYLKERKSPLAEKAHMEQCSSTGITGINEVIKSSAKEVIKKNRIAEETASVEKFLEEIRKEGLAVYGRKETEDAVHMGAVSTLLISESKAKEYEDLLDAVERMQGKVIIIGEDHPAGEQFFHLGGIGGMLRYKIDT